MPFYESLSSYVYRPGRGDSDAVNVGWLARGNAFSVGEVPQGFADRLARLTLRHPVNRMRGWQECHLCEVKYPIQIEVDDERHPVGDAEIRVSGRDGQVYAAPTLISHYVAAHGYHPPDEFVEAVMADERAVSPL